MAKETKIVTLQVTGVGAEAVVAGACVRKLVEEGISRRLMITSMELFLDKIVVRSDIESSDELGAWAARFEPELRAVVSDRPSDVRRAELPRSGEG